jgi:hypothetical protein
VFAKSVNGIRLGGNCRRGDGAGGEARGEASPLPLPLVGGAQRWAGAFRTVFEKSSHSARGFSTSRSSGRDIRYRWTGRKADPGRLDFLMSRNRHGSVCRAELSVKREPVTVVPDLSCCCETSTREWIARGLQDLGQSRPAVTQPPLSSGRGTTSRASEGHCEWRLISNWKQN